MTNRRSEIPEILRNLPWSLWLFAAFWISLSVYWQCFVHRPGILGDMWYMLSAYQQLGSMDMAGAIHELFRPFAQVHVLAVPKFFFWLNFVFFNGSGSVLKFFSFLFCLANALLLCRIVVRDIPATINPAGIFPVGLLVFLNGFQTLVMDWDFLLQHYLAVFFSLAAFLVYERWHAWSLSFLLVMLACFSCGSGLATLVSMGFLLLVRRERWQVMLVYAVFAAVILYVVFPEPAVMPEGIANVQQQTFFWSAPLLLLQYLSYPFSAWGDFRWLGLLLVVMSGESFYRCVSLKKNAPISDFLVCYFFLIACSVVWGRYRFFTVDTDLSRFYVYIAPLWFLALARLARESVLLFRTFTVIVCGFLTLGGLAAIAVASDHAGRMDMARVVALNGNFSHLAGLRLNAMSVSENQLQQQSDYLREHGMDIYYPADPVLSGLPLSSAACAIRLQRKAVVSKGKFVDYFFSTTDSSDQKIILFYATDESVTGNSLDIRYYGVAVAAVNRMKGWQIPLNQIGGRDWPLLVPLAWLPANQTVLYTHLPREQSLDSLQWWGVTVRGQRCLVELHKQSVSAAQE